MGWGLNTTPWRWISSPSDFSYTPKAPSTPPPACFFSILANLRLHFRGKTHPAADLANIKTLHVSAWFICSNTPGIYFFFLFFLPSPLLFFVFLTIDFLPSRPPPLLGGRRCEAAGCWRKHVSSVLQAALQPAHLHKVIL